MQLPSENDNQHGGPPGGDPRRRGAARAAEGHDRGSDPGRLAPFYMWGSGTGSEVMRGIAAPMVGGMVTAPLLSMFVIPAVFLLMRRPLEGKAAPWAFWKRRHVADRGQRSLSSTVRPRARPVPALAARHCRSRGRADHGRRRAAPRHNRGLSLDPPGPPGLPAGLYGVRLRAGSSVLYIDKPDGRNASEPLDFLKT